MDLITVEHNPSPMKLDAMQLDSWPVASKEPGTFQCTYKTKEVCYLLSGEALVTPDGGEPVTIKARDLVNFAKGLSCTWEVRATVKRHYLVD